MRILARIGLDAGNREFARKAADIADLVAQRNPGVATLDGTALHIRGLLADDPGVTRRRGAILSGDRPGPSYSPMRSKTTDRLCWFSTGPTRASTRWWRRPRSINGSAPFRAAVRCRNFFAATASAGFGSTHPTPRPATGWAALTPTESRVVDLISAGHSNRSAAGELGVSPNTVNTHLRAVFRKLDVKSRVQLTIAFREHSPH